MKDQATFTRMQDGTREDYEIIERAEAEFVRGLPERVLGAVEALAAGGLGGYPISRYEHSLQSASRALRDGRDSEYVVAALVHDIGDTLAPLSHGSLAAAVLRPYVSERVSWIVDHHPVFQMHYYAAHTGGDPDARERYRGHQWFDDTVEFCEKYDENCFDPAYQSFSLETFAPLVKEVFGRTPWTQG
ncbi:HD domain-containing protein [Streptomyces sp. NPDC058067]|uniref:HD domain-containing protein n=1 Tax=Streptomyces sp. NPDC058067 TaxID=3346324 RepID=UPI0036E38FD1